MSESHSILDGKVHVYLRSGSKIWQCSTYLSGRNLRRSTGRTQLVEALGFARDWYLEQLSADRDHKRTEAAGASAVAVRRTKPTAPAKPNELTFREASAIFQTEYVALTAGERSAT